MSVFRCKMCGAALDIQEKATVAVCEYCGTSQTLPRLDDDRRVNLYDRANHFRRNNEFDKAMGIYESILNEDGTDAEAYWSLILCRYGIEYVEDPASHKRIPTVNRAQFTSVFDDDNYKSALQYADLAQRELYEKEAKQINEIQKGILEISGKEEPFDVFICYKETDNNGKRTVDSVLAAELYQELVREGFKVFFARITLEDKLGVAYEPYIFAALNSSKVMVALGTRPEHFNAVWVKNEWSRYLALIKQGQKKMLIPAYKDMDPYDLPEEFSHLQAQDMSRLGFMQDLVRGVKKIVGKDTSKKAETPQTPITSATGANVASLLKRAHMFLEDGEFENANEYAEKILDTDPECAEAYLVKLLVEFGLKKTSDLANCNIRISDSNNYKKAVRFASPELKGMLEGYNNTIEERIRVLEDQAYEKAVSLMDNGKYDKAIEQFKKISSYKDSAEMIKRCEELKAEQERKRISKRRKRLIIIAMQVLAVCIAFVILLITVINPSIKYNYAISLLGDGNYSEAADIFDDLGDYKDSVDKKILCYQYLGYHRAVIYGYGITEYTIPDGVTSINAEAFYGCTSLTSITIPDSVTSIGASAFKGCTNLTSITLPFVGASRDGTKNTHLGYIFGATNSNGNNSNVPSSLKTVVITGYTSIDDSAFSGCASIENVTIPYGVMSIGKGAFLGCTSLASITIPDSVTSIGASAFRNCTNLESVTLPDGLTSIVASAFKGCTNLTSVTIPNSVTYIGDYAFTDCASLDKINYRGTETQWNDIKKGGKWNYDAGEYEVVFNYSGD